MEPVLQVALDHMHLKRATDKPARAKELEKLGVDYLNMHVSNAEQMIAHTPLQELKAVAAATSLPVAVAGGLNSETVGQALKAGASIVIVGGAIIKAEDVAGATRTIKKAILQRKSIPTGLYKKYTDADVGKAFRKVSTPNLADAMQKRGVMTGLVPRIKHGTKLVGRAVTVKTADGDWAKPVEAIDRARAGGRGGGRPARWSGWAAEPGPAGKKTRGAPPVPPSNGGGGTIVVGGWAPGSGAGAPSGPRGGEGPRGPGMGPPPGPAVSRPR